MPKRVSHIEEGRWVETKLWELHGRPTEVIQTFIKYYCGKTARTVRLPGNDDMEKPFVNIPLRQPCKTCTMKKAEKDAR